MTIEDTVAKLQKDLDKLKVKETAPKFDLPTYEGRADEKTFREFLERFYLIGNVYAWDNAQCCRIIPTCLRGEALAVYQTLDQKTKADWEKLCNALYEKLCVGGDEVRHQQMLNTRVQGPKESVSEFALAIKALVQRAYPKGKTIGGNQPYTDEFTTHQAVNYFLAGLRPNLKEHLMRQTRPDTLEDAIAQAIQEEQIQRALREEILSRDKVVASVQLEASNTELKEELGKLRKDIEQVAFVNTSQGPPPRPPAPRTWERQADTREFGRPRFENTNRPPWRPRFDTSNRPPWRPRFDNFRPSWRFNSRPSFPAFRGPRLGNFGSSGQDRFTPRRFTDRRPQMNGGDRNFRRDRSQSRGNFPRNRSQSQGRRFNGSNQQPLRDRFTGGGQRTGMVNAILPMLAILAFSVSFANAQYQICSESKGGYSMAVPTTQQTVADLFIPRVIPVSVTAYRCTRLVQTICTYSVVGIITSPGQAKTSYESVPAEACWTMIKNGTAPGNVTLSQKDADYMQSDEVLAPRRGFFGSTCNNVTNYIVRKGSIGSMDGNAIISDLTVEHNCT
ncbi:Retrotransposon gag protein, partial [Aphelenchoides avenae]